MGKYDKLIDRILSGKHDNTMRFAEVMGLLTAFGFTERVKGSHHICHRADVEEILNLQPNGAKAKPYQVKQIRNLILKYKLEVKTDEQI
jgi:predicted RNA binding protein YcfA (HicA-like mRNA interferase family)